MLKHFVIALSAATLCAATFAKLPTPVLTDEAKAKAAEAAAKTAHTGKVDGYKLCLSMEKAAAHYMKTAKAAGKEPKPAQASPACADPGPFVYTPAAPAAAAAASAAAPAVAADSAAKKP